MIKRKINYRKCWDSLGYTYNQTVSITKKEFDNINSHINSLLNKENTDFWNSLSCEKHSFVQPLISTNGLCFTTHTVRNIVSDFLQLDIKDRNTIFKII